MSVAEIAREIGADSLSFISVDGLYQAIADARRHPDAPQFCDACFTGEYPIQLAAGLSANKVSHGSGR
jgi:amidophosphoribosyltransferase